MENVGISFTKKRGRFKTVTVNWFLHESGPFELFASELVISEIAATQDDALRDQMIQLVKEHNIKIVRIKEDALELASVYRTRVIPNEKNDSIHIACAVLNRVDAILSWNFKHLVNLRTIAAIHAINTEKALAALEIIPPEQLEEGKYVDI